MPAPLSRTLISTVDPRLPKRHGHLAVRRRELRGVVQEIGDDLGDARLVADDPDVLARNVEAHVQTTPAQHGPMIVGRTPNDSGHVDWRPAVS
jgi:hypothetical protein